jgi:CO/xanthine dehydrogenase FAD-binding subunit
MNIQRYVRPDRIADAYDLIHKEKGVPIGGGAWTRMNRGGIDLAVDLSGLGLRYIRVKEKRAALGAMTRARDVETSKELQGAFGSLFSDAAAHIVGVQLRNIVSVGGTVSGGYGFSDLNTALLALEASVTFYREGQMPLEDYLEKRPDGARLIEEILIPMGTVKAAFQSVRKTRTDFAVLNAAVVRRPEGWRIAVGARPGAARLSLQAARILDEEGDGGPTAEAAKRAGEAAAEELSFGKDLRGSAEYRKEISSVLVRRCVEETIK